MPNASPYPRTIRKGIAKNFTLEADAVVLLKALVPNSKGVGRMVSELIRREYDKRAERLSLVPAVTQDGGRE